MPLAEGAGFFRGSRARGLVEVRLAQPYDFGREGLHFAQDVGGAEVAVEQMIGSGLFVAALEEDGGEELVGGGDDERGCMGPDRTRGWTESDRVWLDVAEKEELTVGCVVADEEGGGVVRLGRAEDSPVGYWDREDGKLRVQRGVDSGCICRWEVGRKGVVKVRGMVDAGIRVIVGERGPDVAIEDLGDVVEDAFDTHNPTAGEGDRAASDGEWDGSRKRSSGENQREDMVKVAMGDEKRSTKRKALRTGVDSKLKTHCT